jgi:hypothetical protein
LSGIKEILDKHHWLEIKYIYQAGSTLKIECWSGETYSGKVGCKKPHSLLGIWSETILTPTLRMGLFALKPLLFPPPFLWRKEKVPTFQDVQKWKS